MLSDLTELNQKSTMERNFVKSTNVKKLKKKENQACKWGHHQYPCRNKNGKRIL